MSISSQVKAQISPIRIPVLKQMKIELDALTPASEPRCEIKQLLKQRFNSIDFDEAKADVLPFVKDKSKLDLWNKEFFIAITENLQAD